MSAHYEDVSPHQGWREWSDPHGQWRAQYDYCGTWVVYRMIEGEYRRRTTVTADADARCRELAHLVWEQEEP